MSDFYMIFLPPKLHKSSFSENNDGNCAVVDFHLISEVNLKNVLLYDCNRSLERDSASFYNEKSRNRGCLIEALSLSNYIPSYQASLYVVVQQALPLEYRTIEKGQWQGSLMATRLLWVGDPSLEFFPLYISQSKWLKHDYRPGDVIWMSKIQLFYGKNKTFKGARTMNDSNVKVLLNIHNDPLINICNIMNSSNYVEKQLIPWFLSRDHMPSTQNSRLVCHPKEILQLQAGDKFLLDFPCRIVFFTIKSISRSKICNLGLVAIDHHFELEFPFERNHLAVNHLSSIMNNDVVLKAILLCHYSQNSSKPDLVKCDSLCFYDMNRRSKTLLNELTRLKENVSWPNFDQYRGYIRLLVSFIRIVYRNMNPDANKVPRCCSCYHRVSLEPGHSENISCQSCHKITTFKLYPDISHVVLCPVLESSPELKCIPEKLELLDVFLEEIREPIQVLLYLDYDVDCPNSIHFICRIYS